jgi:hypothetical protein
LQALDRQTGAPRFNDAVFYIAATQYGTCFRAHFAHSANSSHVNIRTRAKPQFRHRWLDELARGVLVRRCTPLTRRCKTDDEISWSNARHLPDANAQEENSHLE